MSPHKSFNIHAAEVARNPTFEERMRKAQQELEEGLSSFDQHTDDYDRMVPCRQD